MTDIFRRRGLLILVGLSLVAGGGILILASAAKRDGRISPLSEDVLQLAAWCVFLLPLLVFSYSSVGSKPVRRASLWYCLTVIAWRFLDIADEIPALRDAPFIGSQSHYHSALEHALTVLSGGCFLLIVLFGYDQLASGTERLRESNARFGRLFNNMPTVCFTFDRTGAS